MKTLLLMTMAGAVVLAQTPTAAPVGGTVRVVGAGIGPGVGPGTGPGLAPTTVQFVAAANVGPVIAGAPYSAEAVNETIQILADGNRIVDKNTTKQYRDSQGRERRELGPMIVISDPVAKVRYNLHPQTKTAEKTTEGSGRTFFFGQAAGFQQTITLERRYEAGTRVAGTYGFPTAVTSSGLLLNGVRQVGEPVELLPAKNIEGVIANGTRIVRTIPAGEVGNERPIEVIDESWTSPELGVTVLTTHSDPRSGTTTYKLTNINRSEPPRSLFEVPADYTLVESPINVIRKREE